MSEFAKWLAGLTAVALVATVVRSKYSSGIVTASGGAIKNVYLGAQGIK